jgi:hypothetical protein
MTLIEEITREKFGDDAKRLLNAHAIIPLVDPSKPKSGIKDWNKGFDPTQLVKFHSLAVLTGPRSGITVWDIDSADITPPVTPNVRTAKGSHIYTRHAGEARKIKVVDGLDVLGNNGYAIFYGPGKSFIHADPADLHVMTDWMKNFSPISSLKGSNEGFKEGYEEGIYEGYYNQMLAEGYQLDVEAIERGYVALMRSRPEGVRNNSLLIYARELLRCGIETSGLREAALVSGLPPNEVDVTISQAEADVAMLLSPSVFTKVKTWQDTTWHIVPRFAREVVDHLAKRAIETNDMSPFIVQQDIVDALAAKGIQRTQQSVSKTLVALDSTYGVIKIIFLGYQDDGRRKPNAYRLCIDGQPVSDLTRRQPLASANSPAQPDATEEGGE